MFAGTAEGMMIMIAPAQAQPVLPEFLDARRPVAAFPIGALGLEENLAGLALTNQFQTAVQQPAGQGKSLRVILPEAPTRMPHLLCLQN